MRGKGVKLGVVGYANALAEVYRQGTTATVDDIADLLETNRRKALMVANAMERGGLIHVHAWVPREGTDGRCTFWTPAYAPGPGERPPHPNGATGKPRRARIATSVHALSAALYALQDCGKTIPTLAKELCTSWTQVRRILKALRDGGLVHISGWQIRPDGSTGGAEYEWGPGKANKPKPKPQPKTANWAKANAKTSARNQHLRLLAATAGPLRQAA